MNITSAHGPGGAEIAGLLSAHVDVAISELAALLTKEGRKMSLDDGLLKQYLTK